MTTNHLKTAIFGKVQGIALASVLACSLTACVSGPELRLPITARSDDCLQVVWLHTYPHKAGILLMGHVRRTGAAVGPVWGHLHVVAEFSDGSKPLVVDTRWSGSISRRGNRTAPFSTVLRTENPGRISSINVEYRIKHDP